MNDGKKKGAIMKKFRIVMVTALVTVACLLMSSCNVVTEPPASSGAADAGSKVTASTLFVNGGTDTPLKGASVVLKMGHCDANVSLLEYPWNCYSRVFKNSLEIYTNGEVTCQIFPADQLGDLTSGLEQCVAGTLDVMASIPTGNFGVWESNISVFDIPYITSNLDVANLVCQGPVFRELRDSISEKAGITLLSICATAYRDLQSCKTPVKTPDDLYGMKFRTQQVGSHIAMAKAWGSIPSVVAWSELYSAASTGVIDAFENPDYAVLQNSLFEVVKYYTQTRHLVNTIGVVINTERFNSLTDTQQEAVLRAADDARRATLGTVAANQLNTIGKLQAAGIEIIGLTAEERKAFKDACYDEAKGVILDKVDPDFYQLFLDEYAKAEETLGITRASGAAD